MTIKYGLNMKLGLVHKNTGKEFKLESNIEKKYDEDSKEYEVLCEQLQNKIPFDRESDKDKFDEQVVRIGLQTLEHIGKEKIENINMCCKQCYAMDKNGWIEFGGAIINPKDFCIIKVVEFKTYASKH